MTKTLEFYAYPTNQTEKKYFCRMYQVNPENIELSVFTAPKTAEYYSIPVKQKDGFAWKCYKKYVACTSGNAADIMDIFKEFPAYASATVCRIVFKDR